MRYLVFFILLIPFCVQAQSIAFLGLDASGKQKKELDSCRTFLEKNYPDYFDLSLDSILDNPDLIYEFDLIWVHRPDSSEFDENEVHPDIINGLHAYLDEGGKILFTNEAVQYLNIMGLEENEFQVRNKNADDNGYGRMLGLHGFSEHGVFKGLNNGAYIIKPHENLRVRQIGFFDEALPHSAKVIAVDWDYIFVREDKKLMFEYLNNDGRAIAIGAYVYFAMPNYNKKHLEKLIQNSIDYLLENIKTNSNYWDYSEQLIIPWEDLTYDSKLIHTKATSWDMIHNTKALVREKATKNAWDIAGRRMLITGDEAGGIEEIWAHPFMAIRDYELGMQVKGVDSILWLSGLSPEIEVTPEAFIRKYKTNGFELKEVICADPYLPRAVFHYEFAGNLNAELIIKYKTNLRLMWPYSSKVLSELKYGFLENLNAYCFSDNSENYNILVGINKPLKYKNCGHYEDLGFAKVISPSETQKFQAAAYMSFPLKPNDVFDVILAAGNEEFKDIAELYEETLAEPFQVYMRSFVHYQDLLDNSLQINSPNEEFNEGYQWALVGTDRFFTTTPGLGTSLVAGFSSSKRGWDGGHDINGRPGYAWYFGRDGEWSGMAVLDYGDFSGVRQMLEMYNKYQDLNGKIFHELSTSGFVHYDASDATPLYVVLAGKYLAHSGDIAFIKESWPHIKKAMDYCYSTDTDDDFLIENTMVGHGWVEGGHLFGSHTSLYLASCWQEALENAAYMAKVVEEFTLAKKYSYDANTVKGIINIRYWNSFTSWFFQGIKKDGSYHNSESIMPAIPMYFEQVDAMKTKRFLYQVASNEFSGDWGTRITGMNDPHYNPGGYHTGSVWPLYTGWASLAEYKYGNAIQGFSHIMNNLINYKHYSLGFVDEVLHGEEYKPFGVCPHQCWSETMVIQPIIEGMLGFSPDAVNNSFKLHPNLPADWDSLNIKNLKVGNGNINFDFRRENGKYNYTFTKDIKQKYKVYFSPVIPTGTTVEYVKLNEELAFSDVAFSEKGVFASIEFELSGSMEVEIGYSGGISVLPMEYELEAGMESAGLRILNTEWKNDKYMIDLEGAAGSEKVLRLYYNLEETPKVKGGEIIELKNNILSINVKLDGIDGKTSKILVIVK
ncbi:GH116 family glycosyl hydrolase [Bacteroidota bacterium]